MKSLIDQSNAIAYLLFGLLARHLITIPVLAYTYSHGSPWSEAVDEFPNNVQLVRYRTQKIKKLE